MYIFTKKKNGKGAGGDGLSVRLLGGRGAGHGGRGQIHEPVGFFLYIVWDEAKDHTHLKPCCMDVWRRKLLVIQTPHLLCICSNGEQYVYLYLHVRML